MWKVKKNAAEGAHVKVTADGSDEESAIEGIEKYLSNQ